MVGVAAQQPGVYLVIVVAFVITVSALATAVAQDRSSLSVQPPDVVPVTETVVACLDCGHVRVSLSLRWRRPHPLRSVVSIPMRRAVGPSGR